MFKYTFSAINDTFDFIKKTLHFADVAIQLFYIMYVVYRILNNWGILYVNITLLVLTCGYLIYHLFLSREFYTKKQLKQKATVRNVVKGVKYIIRMYIIVKGVMQIYQSSTTDNIAMLMIVLLIIGFILSIIFDFIKTLMKSHINLIKFSILYDVEKFKERHGEKFTTLPLSPIVKKLNIDIDRVPVVNSEKMRKRIEDANHKQENKKRRKEHFKIINEKSDKLLDCREPKGV